MESSWARAVDAIIRGESGRFRRVRLGPTPTVLKQFGLVPADLTMSAAKIATARRDHPEVSLDTWHNLPALLNEPHAIFPSTREDGTLIVVIAVVDDDGNPIIVPIIANVKEHTNTVLSVYGKQGNDRRNGHEWVALQVSNARKEGRTVYEKSGSADSKPRPESADAISWSPDLISVDRSTEPQRSILTMRSFVKKS
jgi:hypothetical protein